ncbi:MAG: hypothetical protein IJX89_02145 [Alphaproteobacteria bacterium]|nr:hypothetical protein [Alphaproteobacteria bacterium]
MPNASEYCPGAKATASKYHANKICGDKSIMTKRLFIFAGYSAKNIIDETLIYYLGELSKLGDIVLVFDCQIPSPEIQKLDSLPNILHIDASQHNEYDFGSYKRGYIWAENHNLFQNYEWIYFVNDSVFGPIFNLNPILTDMESQQCDFTGLVQNQDNVIPKHIQSWFVGMTTKIAQTEYVKNFIQSITRQSSKEDIVCKYEVRLSQLLLQHGHTMYAYSQNRCADAGHKIYQKPMQILQCGIPFIKKNLISEIGNLRYLTPYVKDEQLIEHIKKYAINYGIPLTGGDKRFCYKTRFKVSLFGIPMLMIQRKKVHEMYNYKVLIFNKIPLCKIHKHICEI